MTEEKAAQNKQLKPGIQNKLKGVTRQKNKAKDSTGSTKNGEGSTKNGDGSTKGTGPQTISTEIQNTRGKIPNIYTPYGVGPDLRETTLTITNSGFAFIRKL